MPKSKSVHPLDTQEQQLGQRLRAIRMSRGLSMRAVAATAEITPGGLSQIENGENSPALGTLRKLVTALGISMSEFFAAETEAEKDENRIVFRASELQELAPSKGLRFLALPKTRQPRAIQVLYETYLPHFGDTATKPYSNTGEESGFCIAGTLELRVGNRREILGPGDAYYYSAKLPHTWRNVGKVPAIVVSACTPPTC